MKKSSIYLLIVIFFVVVVSFIVVKYQHDRNVKASRHFKLQDRKGAATQTAEWSQTRMSAAKLLDAVKKNPDDSKSALALAALFIQEARVTGNFTYYDLAAMKYVNDVLKRDPRNFEALTYKALIQLSQHHFAEGLATAQQAQKINPYNAFVYGMLVDAHVELGNYHEAVENSDKMISVRPDLRSYSRIAYLREIHGDYPGAIEAMKMAVEAGYPGQEGTEWCRIQLGKLYENIGDLRNAEMHYTISLEERPGYAYALAGLARIAAAKGDYKNAIETYQLAYTTINDYSFKEELMEVYKLQGNKKKAEALAKEVIYDMTQISKDQSADDSAGHYSDRELAYAYLNVNDHQKALEHALLEYNRRPHNIDVNETVAWVYYHTKEYKKALPYLQAAFKTNSKNPTLLCRGGLIYHKIGDNGTAKKVLQAALQNNPTIAPSLKAEVSNTLKSI